MRYSRGMGIINPSKMPGKKVARRKDGDKFDMYSEGGEVENSSDDDRMIKFNEEAKNALLQMKGEGGAGKSGRAGYGRAEATKRLAKDTELQGYLEGSSSSESGKGRPNVGGGMMIIKRFEKGGPVWDQPNPKKSSKPMTPARKAAAKKMAKAAGRPYPNLVDNIRASRKK